MLNIISRAPPLILYKYYFCIEIALRLTVHILEVDSFSVIMIRTL